MSTQDADLMGTLRKAQRELGRLSKEHKAELAAIEHRRRLLTNTIAGLQGKEPKPEPLGISNERLSIVQEYMKKNHRATQQQIAEDTALNSGTVSVALKRLGWLVEKEAEKENGRQVWRVKAKAKRHLQAA